MRKLVLVNLALFLSLQLTAQKTSGTIVYKIVNIDFVDKGTNADVTNMFVTANKQQYQLLFNKEYASFTLVDYMADESTHAFYNKMAKIYLSGFDYYYDYSNSILLEASPDGDLLEQKLKKIPWEITSESKMIDTYQCYKATYTFEYLMRGGTMKPRVITAWFAPSLPYAFGPKNYYGLPGLILELTDRTVTFLVSEIRLSDTEIEIKIPKGRRIPKEEFEKALLNIKY